MNLGPFFALETSFYPLINLPLLSFAAWAKAVAALMIIGLLILIVAFIISCVALCCSLNIPLLPFVGVLLIVVGEMTPRSEILVLGQHACDCLVEFPVLMWERTDYSMCYLGQFLSVKGDRSGSSGSTEASGGKKPSWFLSSAPADLRSVDKTRGQRWLFARRHLQFSHFIVSPFMTNQNEC